MSWIHGARARLHLLVSRRATEDRIRTEVAFHIDMEADRLIREEGLAPEDARRRALALFGGTTQHSETLRDGRGFGWLGGFSLDVKLAIRMLVKNPALSLVAILGLSVAVAIGAVCFSAIHAVLDSPLPFRDGDRVIAIRNVDARDADAGARTHLHDFPVWRQGLRAVDEIGAYRIVERNFITLDDRRSESVPVAEMTASGFRIAQVPPLMGRTFSADDERAGAALVAVIGYDVWQTRFTARADIIGRTIQLGDARYTVVGVMPRGFAFPINNQVWTPFRLSATQFAPNDAPAIGVFARLADGARVADVQRELSTIGQRLAADDSATHGHVRVRAIPYTNILIDSPETAWALYLAQILVSLLVAVIGTNVAILVYARTASRLGEIALRTALGAGRRRIVAQLFAEALAMSTIAAAVGLSAASLALGKIDAVVARMAGTQIPYWVRFHLTPSVFVYCAALAVFGAVIVGVVPALKATRQDVRANLQRLGAGGSGVRLGKTWTMLVITQVAMAVAVLPVAMAGIAAWGRIDSAESAVASRQVLTASLVIDHNDEVRGDRAVESTLRTDFVDRLRGDAHVSAVVFASSAPGAEATTRVDVERRGNDSDQANAKEGSVVGSARIEPGYFAAFDIPMLAGRGFQNGDARSSANVVIVNQSFVTKVLGGTNPLGRRIRATAPRGSARDDASNTTPWEQIVGVVPDFPVDSSTPNPKVYRPLATPESPATMVIRLAGVAPMTFIPRLRELSIATSPMVRLENIEPLTQTLSDQNAPRRLTILALELVTLSAVLLSAAGIYALVSFTVTRRRHEIGIRSALGAGARRLLANLFSRVFTQIAIGILVGLSFATLVDKLLDGGWTGRRGDIVLPGVALLMAAIAMIATLGPASRALSIDPREAMRGE